MSIRTTSSRFIAKLLFRFAKFSPLAHPASHRLHTRHAGQLMKTYGKTHRPGPDTPHTPQMIMGPIPLMFDQHPLSTSDWGDLDKECICSTSDFPDIILVESDCPRHGYDAFLNKSMQRAAEDNAIISKADLIRRTSRAEARMRARHRRFPN